MKTAARLGLYAAGAAVAFASAFGVAAAVVPDSAVAEWTGGDDMQEHTDSNDHDEAAQNASADATLPGLSLSAHGFALSPVSAPRAIDEPGELRFQVITEAGDALSAFETSHGKDLHLIVVRSDGAEYRHVHPVLDEASGTWSMPWTWDEAGSYRVYADFAPAVEDGPEKVTLTRTVDVSGPFEAAPRDETKTIDEIDGFEVSVDGQLVAGSTQELTITVRRDNEPVTALQPYLGAFGHLVALREGDLAYLHVHAEGDEPDSGEVSGPKISFAAQAPTAGRYLLYLDFQVDGRVHTAEFVVDAIAGGGAEGSREGSE
jgi:hypothetical protein